MPTSPDNVACARQMVETYYYPRTNGQAWGRRSREYCEGVLDLAIELGLTRTEIVEVTATHATADEQATSVVEQVVRSSTTEAARIRPPGGTVEEDYDTSDPMELEWQMALDMWDKFVTRQQNSDPSTDEA